MLSYSRKQDKIPLEKRYKKVRRIIMRASKFLKNEVIIEGEENIPEQASCFFPNHVGATDPFLFFEAFDKPVTFVAKKETEKIPFVGRVFRADSGLFLDREDIKQQLKVMLKVQSSLANNEMHWVIFPEGTRNKDPMARMLDFHHGTFRPAYKAKAPIVPVAVYGSFRLLSKKHSFKKYPTFIKILKPIYFEEYEGKTTEEISKMVYNAIEKEISFNARRLDHERMLKLKDKKYRFNKVY